ncbi:hypothetical protein AN219_19970 [Streptomyces nanshensis]|nr:hypothetical protein AN219_19970 [Streptomyces nanshensis]
MDIEGPHGQGLFRRLFPGLFRDLVRDAFVFRPLPPAGGISLPGGAGRSVPAAARNALRFAPHGGLLMAVLLLVTLQARAEIGLSEKLPGMALLAAALLTAAFWPVVSAWLLLVATAVSLFRPGAVAAPFPFADLSHSNVLQYGSQERPWAWAGLFAFAALLVVLGLRLRVRAVAWLWVLVVALAAVGNGPFIVGTSVTALLSGLMPLVAVVSTGWREAREEAAAQAVAADGERSRRMLLEERAAIARELHDVVAHHMSVVAIQAEAAPYRVANPPPELEKAFGNVRENAVAALAELRRVLGVIRDVRPSYPSPFAHGGMPSGGGGAEVPQPALRDLDALLAGAEAAGPRPVKTVTGAVRPLPRGVELSAYRIVQEALSNALRHAPGTAVRVELAYSTDGLGLRVVNDPPSVPAPPSPGAGHGLTGMRERAAMLGGRLTAGRRDDGGFEVSGYLPGDRAGAVNG